MKRLGRRGSHAIEFALSVPILFGLASGVIDLGLYLIMTDATVAATANGARSGAVLDQDDGGDPVAQAEQIAAAHWSNLDLPGTPTFSASLTGSAPDQLLVLDATVPYTGFFGFLPLPEAIEYSYVMRVVHQPS